MFENILGGDSQRSPVDILDTLLDPVNIAGKTDLNIIQIQILTKLKWFQEVQKEENKNKHPLEILNLVMDYYLVLMCSLKRKSREEIIQGLSEMKDKFMENELMVQQMMSRKG